MWTGRPYSIVAFVAATSKFSLKLRCVLNLKEKSSCRQDSLFSRVALSFPGKEIGPGKRESD